MATTRTESEPDLLSQIKVVVACEVCGTSYSVPASIVRESQRLLAEDYCSESLFECDALFYATLIDADAIADLERAWARFEESATSHGGTRIVVVASGPDVEAGGRDVRTPERSENEADRCEHVRAAFAERRARAVVGSVALEPRGNASSEKPR
jgi:hypothetical protein